MDASDTADAIVAFLQVLLTLLVGAGGGGGLMAYLAGRKAREANVAKNEQKARAEQRMDTRRELRLLADYAHELRRALMTTGEEVPPWPENLKHLT